MDFYQLVGYIRQLGCRVNLYERTELRVNKCEGTFQISKKGNPVISIAMKGFETDNDRLLTLLHEFAHYIQWVTGYWGILHRETDGWDIVDKFLRYKRRKLSQEEIIKARRSVLLLEYDAELRTISLAKFFSIPIDELGYLQSANAYILQIKWALETKKWGSEIERYDDIDAGVFTVENLLAPLTHKEKNLIGRLP